MKQLETEHLILRMTQNTDASKFKEFEQRNKMHLAQWSPIYDFTDEQYQKLIENWVLEEQEGKSIRFFIYAKDDPQEKIIGLCHFSNIVKGLFQACYLGYKIDHAYQGKGLMFQALRAAIDFMFNDISLHRIMANYMPNNTRSGQLLTRLGFAIEGTAKEYLLVNGRWEDHILTSLINHAWKKN